MTINMFNLTKGSVPLLISIPHCGTYIPDEIEQTLTDAARRRPDTDWHLESLYAFAKEMGASVLTATHSRYVIDLNRPPTGESLYPGQTTTGLCPLETFPGDAVYQSGQEPDENEVAERVGKYWQPYHSALEMELERLRGEHGKVLLWEAHSIASYLPRLFDGKLPDLNFGTAKGNSCSAAITDAVVQVAQNTDLSWVANGRFTGGYNTRHYGRPERQVYAIQLEMSQDLYMNEQYPYELLEGPAERLQPILRSLLETALAALESS